MEVRAYNESLVPYRPPPSRGRWSKGGEVNPQAPPPFIGCWPNYAVTIGASSNKSKIKKTIRKGKRITVGQNLIIQLSPSIGCNFRYKASSNYDIID